MEQRSQLSTVADESNNRPNYRPSDYLAPTVQVDINQVINDTLIVVKHDLSRKSIRVALDLRSTACVGGNHQQFQQVLINLIVNATNAMDDAGNLKIRSKNWKNQGGDLLYLTTDVVSNQV